MTNILYSGEPFDAKIGQQYLRARWYDPATGRFNRLDPFFGNLQDPQSLHKYLYVHGDPVQGVDPSGLFSLGGMLASFSIGGQNRGMESSNAATGVQAGQRTRQIVQIYQKALRVFDRASDIYEYARDLIDLLSFNPRSLKAIKDALVARGINGLVSHLPSRVVEVDLKIPKAMLRKMRKVRGIAYKVLGHYKVQEFLGEMATALIIKVLDFGQSDLQLDTVRGPDQVAEHERTGVWGIFEAKGGKSRLGSAYGGQMSGEWITRWIRKLIRSNYDTEAGKRLERAYGSRRQMIAAVTRLNLNVKKVNGRWASPEFKVAVQKYDPPNGRRMAKWGPNW